MKKITQPVFITIQQEATGKRMRQLFQQNGYTVRDVQTAMGFENPQAIYKWLSGRSLPSIDNLIVLSVILHVSIEEILVLGEDFCRFWKNIFKIGILLRTLLFGKNCIYYF